MMHDDDIAFAKEIIVDGALDTPYGKALPIPLSLLKEAIESIEELEDRYWRLLTVAMTAADEIEAHWNAHCDAEGYGPVNLVSRLRNPPKKDYYPFYEEKAKELLK